MASPFYLDLVGEQGLVQLGKVTSPPFSIYQPETGTHQQSRYIKSKLNKYLSKSNIKHPDQISFFLLFFIPFFFNADYATQ
tara:strand:- start:1168 stop:1410 length:243 start_codon:yes stop_codon:yes gene_type:complete